MCLSSRIPLFVFLACYLFALSACSSTKIVAQWHPPQKSSAKMESLLVVGDVPDDPFRHSLENRFVATLQDLGVNTVASYHTLPDAGDMDLGSIRERAQSLGLQRILVIRLVRRESMQYYQGRYGAEMTPVRAQTKWTETIFRLEAMLYATDGALVWAAETETTAQGSLDEKVDDVVEKLTQQLAEDGVI